MFRYHKTLIDLGTIACFCSWLFIGCATPDERLQSAILDGDIDQVQQSLNNGADSKSALDSAVRNKQVNIARYLLSHGGDPNQQSEGSIIDDFKLINIQTNNKYALPIIGYKGGDGMFIKARLIIELAMYDSVSAEKALDTLRKGQYYYEYKYNPAPGRTLIDYAISNDDTEMVRLLIEYGADITKPHVVKSATPFDTNEMDGSFERLIGERTTQISPSKEFILGTFLNEGSIEWGFGYLVRKGNLVQSTLIPVQAQISTSLRYARSKGNAEIIQLIENAATPSEVSQK